MHLLLLIAALVAQAGLSEERARQILPRADLHALTDQQRAQFLEVAGDTFGYAGCNETLARCLGANVDDKHAVRTAELVKALLLDGQSSSAVVDMVERYYASFAKEKRQKPQASLRLHCGAGCKIQSFAPPIWKFAALLFSGRLRGLRPPRAKPSRPCAR